MIWTFSRFLPQQQQLDTLLANEDVSLETILDADNILNEIKGQGSQKFADFIITHPDEYKKMISYIITYEEELIDRKAQIQYPFYCSEIFASQNEKLIDYLFEPQDYGQENEEIRQQLFPYLMSFVEQDVIYITSSGYFAKTLIAIIKRRGYNVWNYLENKPRIISDLIKHIDIKHISEIIEKLITLDTQQEQIQNYFTQQSQLLNRIIKLMENKFHIKEIVDNVCEILCDITSKCNNNIYYNNNEILPFIEQIKNPQLLFSIALKSQSSMPYQLLINLVELQSKDTNKSEDDEIVHTNEKDYSIFEPILKELPQALQNQNLLLSSIENTKKIVIQPFGLAKMQLLKLITLLIQLNDKQITQTLLQAGLFPILYKISIEYQGNNQVHNHFEKIIRTIIESNQVQLIDQVIESLINFILQYHTIMNKANEYVGFLTSIANYINDKSRIIDVIELRLNENKKWKYFTDNYLESINFKEKIFLCNYNPRKPEEKVEEDEQVQDSILNIIKKFNTYPQQKSPYFEQKLDTNNEDEDAKENDENEKNQDKDENDELDDGDDDEDEDDTENFENRQRTPYEFDQNLKIADDNEVLRDYENENHDEFAQNNYWKNPNVNAQDAELILKNYS